MTPHKLQIFKTPTAHKKLKQIYSHSRQKWGKKQAQKYMMTLEKAIESIAAGKTPPKKRPEFSTRFYYHIAGKHYIFYEFQKDILIIATIFHIMMDVGERMQEEITGINKEIIYH
jgi:toxin ParE1/3/4